MIAFLGRRPVFVSVGVFMLFGSWGQRRSCAPKGRVWHAAMAVALCFLVLGTLGWRALCGAEKSLFRGGFRGIDITGAPYGQDFRLTDILPCTLIPLEPTGEPHRKALIVEALLQQSPRSHTMSVMRTGPVTNRVIAALRLLGHWPPSGGFDTQSLDDDALRESLPPLRDIAELVDAKTETVCRVLAHLLPPRSRKTGPETWARTAQDAAARALCGVEQGFTGSLVEVAA